MPDDALLELESRRRVYALVRERPGMYLREIQRALDMPMGALEYHLDRLEKGGLVTSAQDTNKRFFPAEMDVRDKRYLALLRQRAARHVVLQLLEHPGASHGEVAAATGLAPSTLSFYLARLVEAGVAERRSAGRENRYTLLDPGRAHHLLLAYAPSFLDRVLDGFLDSFDAVRVRKDA